MPFNLDSNSANFQIRGFQPGQILVNDTILTHSIIISAEKLIENWKPQTIAELTAADFSQVIELKPIILLLGTGSELVFPPLEIYGDLLNHGIGVEIMSSAAAARTYNALTAEGRNVVAALIIR